MIGPSRSYWELRCCSERPRLLAVAANRCAVWLVLLMQERRLLDEQLVQQVDMTHGFKRQAFRETAGCECHLTGDADFVS